MGRPRRRWRCLRISPSQPRGRFGPRRDSRWRGSEAPSPRLLEPQHELVDRAGRTVHVEIARIARLAQEIALGDKLEPRGLDFAPQYRLLDTMERAADRDPVTRFRGMVRDHERA